MKPLLKVMLLMCSVWCTGTASADGPLTILLAAKGSGGALGSPGPWKPDSFKERLAGKLTNAGYRIVGDGQADLTGTVEIETSVWKGPDRVIFSLSVKGETVVTVNDSISDYYGGGISLGSMGADGAAEKAAQKIADLVRSSPRIAEMANAKDAPAVPKPAEAPPVPAPVLAAPVAVPVSSPKRAAVAPFATKAGADPSYSEAVQSVVSGEIAKSSCLILATDPQKGSDLTVQGEIVKFGPVFIVSGMMIENSTGRTVASAKFQGPEDQLPAKAEELGAKLATTCP